MKTQHHLTGYKWSREVVMRRIEAGAGRPKNTPSVLWKKVDVRGDDECWPWIGFRNEQGYGRTWINDKGYYAHRVIFDLVNPGQISLSAPKRRSESGFVLHSCDNPSCCNPKHLRLGTHDENMSDKVLRGRSRIFDSLSCPRAKLTRENVLEIRQLSAYMLSATELAKAFGVSKCSIQSVLKGRTFKDVA